MHTCTKTAAVTTVPERALLLVLLLVFASSAATHNQQALYMHVLPHRYHAGTALSTSAAHNTGRALRALYALLHCRTKLLLPDHTMRE
jgi:hypothetical protein